jgi:hypothetical protein
VLERPAAPRRLRDERDDRREDERPEALDDLVRDALARDALERPPRLADFRAEPPFARFEAAFFRPEPLRLPPPDTLFSVAQAIRSASFCEVPRCSYPSSMCRACRFCLGV